MSRHYANTALAIVNSIDRLKLYGQEVDTGHWQGVDTQGRPDMVTRELVNLQFECPIPDTPEQAADLTAANMPWAEDHFQERVSRVPSNPGEQYKNWPWWQEQTAAFDQVIHLGPGKTEPQVPQRYERRFSHTYQERFWPKHAGDGSYWQGSKEGHHGIRYRYGDLDDVVNLLYQYPFTRQATFPIFFPEDTGAVHGGRVPCTLHYHFMLRDQWLYMWYPIRSCDALRHFRDDIYMACRLNQWVLEQLVERELRDDKHQVWVDVNPGLLHFTAYSFHVHKGDMHLLYGRQP